jgi:membrane-associated phospholipid phosphatase
MTTRELVTYRITIFLSLITISIIQIDRPLAIFIETHFPALQETFRKILATIEFMDAYPISRYIIAIVIVVTAVILLLRDKTLQRAKVFFFIGATMASSRLTTAILKSVFDRNRPHAFISDRSVRDFFGSGDSFPSGHATNYFSFFLPLIVIFPRYKWPLLIIPVFVALQRVVVNDHYLSDVIAGTLVASLMTLLFQRIFKIHPPSLFLPPNKTI